MIIGMELERARSITKENIADALGGLPGSKMHCSVLACDAIREALKGFS
jgi:nitrogen fixation NifU-like protein